LPRSRIPTHALVLTAGLGTRLRPLTRIRAKPSIPVAGEALIRRIVRWLVASQVTELVLNLHHLPETVTAVVGDGSDLSARVRYSWEQPVVLGTAGGPRRALPILEADTFLVVNGDTLTDFDLVRLAEHHAESRALVTLALAPNVEPRRYGGVQLDPGGVVTRFVPAGSAQARTFHFVGVQIAGAEAFGELPPDAPANSIGGLYDDLLARRPGSIRGCVVPGTRFSDIGTVADYWRTSSYLSRAAGGEPRGRGARIAPTASVTRSILWDDVEIEAGCRIDECILTDGVRVPAGSVYSRSILLRADRGPAGPGEHREQELLVCPAEEWR
jgi:mannose-1-phosphate guanylyltransferase